MAKKRTDESMATETAPPNLKWVGEGEPPAYVRPPGEPVIEFNDVEALKTTGIYHRKARMIRRGWEGFGAPDEQGS